MATCRKCAAYVSPKQWRCPLCLTPVGPSVEDRDAVTMLFLLGVIVLSISCICLLVIRNLLSFSTISEWGNALYWDNVMTLESDVYLTLTNCEPGDQPYMFSSIPYSLDDAKNGVGAIALPETKQLFVKRGDLQVDGIDWIALETTLNGKPFRGWLRAKSCTGDFDQLEHHQSSIFTPIKGPWTHGAHQAFKAWILLEPDIKNFYISELLKQINDRGIEITSYAWRDADERGLRKKYPTVEKAMEQTNFIIQERAIEHSDLIEMKLLPKLMDSFITKSSASEFADSLEAAEQNTAKYLLQFRGTLYENQPVENILRKPLPEI